MQHENIHENMAAIQDIPRQSPDSEHIMGNVAVAENVASTSSQHTDLIRQKSPRPAKFADNFELPGYEEFIDFCNAYHDDYKLITDPQFEDHTWITQVVTNSIPCVMWMLLNNQHGIEKRVVLTKEMEVLVS